MSLLYSNTPVYIGVPNTSSVNTGFTGSKDYVPALGSDVSFSVSQTPKRNLGVNVVESDQFNFDGALQADISLESLIQAEISEGFRFLSGTREIQESYVPIQIGENLYNKCYPKDVSISIQPYAPVTIRANFVCLDPPTGAQISGNSRVFSQTSGIPISGDDIVYGHTCAVTNMGEVVGNVQSEANFTRTYQRSPVYNLGSVTASSMLLDGVEEELSVTSTGLSQLVNLSGQLLVGTFGFSLLDASSLHDNGALVEIMTLPAGSRVVDQGYSVGGGQSVQTSVTLKNIKL